MALNFLLYQHLWLNVPFFFILFYFLIQGCNVHHCEFILIYRMSHFRISTTHAIADYFYV